MATTTTTARQSIPPRADPRAFATSLVRGVGGGMIIGMPMLLTMEMWWGGFSIPAERQALLFGLNLGVLVILQRFSGLHPQHTLPGQIRAALTAAALGLVVSGVLLSALGVIGPDTTARDILGKVSLESVPVSIGSSVAMSAFGEDVRHAERRRERAGFWGSLGMAIAGAMVLGFSVTATEEPLMLGAHVRWTHAIALVAISLAQVHAVVYAADFRKRPESRDDPVWWQRFLHETVSTYALSLVVGTYLLWTFGSIGPDTGAMAALHIIVVAGFATSLGAAAAELLI